MKKNCLTTFRQTFDRQAVRRLNSMATGNSSVTVGDGVGDVSPPVPPVIHANSVPARSLASFRLPSFSPEESELWLLQVQYSFDVALISDSATKFKLLVANLPMTVAAQVRDIILAKPGDFDALCRALSERLAQSTGSRLEALLRHQELGDQSPSQLLRNMRGQLRAAGAGCADDSPLLKTLFLQRLPNDVRTALSLLPEVTTLVELAGAADRFLTASRPAGIVAAVTVPGSERAAPTQFATDSTPDLQAAIINLTSAVNRLEARSRQQERSGDMRNRPSRSATGTPRSGGTSSRQRAATPNRPRSPSPGRQRSASPVSQLCWYHEQFGQNAHRCQPPCSWNSSNMWA